MNPARVTSAYGKLDALLRGRRRVWSVGLYALVSALPQLASGLLAILYTRAFSPGEYANYGIFAAALALVSFLIDFGLPSAILRNVNADVVKVRIASAIFGARLLVAAALPFAGVILYLFWDELGVRFPQTWAFVPVLLAISYLDVSCQLLATVCRVFHRPDYFAAGRIAQAVGAITGGTLLVFIAKLGVMGALLGLLIGEVCSFLVYQAIVAQKLGVKGGHLSLPLLRSDLSFSLPLVPTRLAGWARLLAVRPLLTHLLPMSSVGFFSFASSLAALPTLISTAVDLALAPIYFQRRDASDNLAFASKLKEFAGVYLASMLPLWVIAVIFSADAIHLLAGEKFLGAAPVLAILLCASYVRMQLPFLLRQIHFLRKTWLLPLITIPNTVLGLTLTILFTGKFGIAAAGFATLGTDLLILISSAWTVRRFEHIDYPIVTALLFTGVLTALAIWSGFGALPLGGAGGIALKLCIAAAVTIACVTFWIWPKRRLVLQLTRG
jgi:O-antigen/teichoic acid export membrane protein